jgi:hypothetical protein
MASLKEKLEAASAAVDKAYWAREDAIQNLMEAEFAHGEALEVWGKLNDKLELEAGKSLSPEVH